MPKDRDGKPPLRQEPTLQVRVRSKNPQIGRRPSRPVEGEEETLHADLDDLSSLPTVRPGRGMMDDDATEIAHSPPPIPREDLVVRRTPVEPKVRRTPAAIASKTVHPKPRNRMEVRGTEGAGALAAKVRVQRIEEGMPQTQHPLLKPYRVLMNDHELSAIERALAGELDARDLRAAGSSPKRALERLVHGAEFNQLALEDRAILLRAVAADPREIETPRAAARLLERGVASGVRPAERSQILELFRLLTARDQQLLADLAERELHGGTALYDRDFEDQSLIAHLHAIASVRSLAGRVEAAGLHKTDALAALLASLAHPEQLPLEDGADGVLSVLEFGLAEASPAECARLWRALTTGDLLAELPGDGALDLGDHLRTRPAMTLNRSETPLRIGLEILAGLAHPRSGGVRTAFVMPGGHGIDADVIARALGYLYGVGFTVAAGSTAALRQLDRVSDRVQRVPPAFISLLFDGGEKLFVFERIERDRVFFRAPHGASTKPRGAKRHDPDRIVEDPARALESIAHADFVAQVGVALVPRT